MKFLSIEKVIAIHEAVVSNYGGLPGIRDIGLLSSAIEMPKSTMFGEYLHPEIWDKAAAYLYHVVCNHPFLDGNKRTGMMCALIFLDMNGRELKDVQNLLEELVVETAQGKVDKREISQFFQEHS